MKLSLLLLCLLTGSGLMANDSLIISRLLQRLDILQTKEDGIFPKGSFPSYRMYALNKHRLKADINPFFTGLIAFTLDDIKVEFSPAQQKLADKIIQQTYTAYPKFKNRKPNNNTYNFWPTDTPRIFTYGGWLNLANKKRALPDDLDDTVILLMAERSADSVARQVHQLMQGFTNKKYSTIVNTFPEYRHIPAYSTWFGKKMPVDFDISVFSNILYFVQYYNLPWTSADSASLFLIEDIIKKKRHLRYASFVSPHYGTVPNILYNVSRLMALKEIPELEKLKPQLIGEALEALNSASTFLDKIILSTALLRWNVVPPMITQYENTDLISLMEDERFSFFTANIATIFPDFWKKTLTNLNAATFYYSCPGFNYLLLLENIAWHKRRRLNR